MQFAQRTGNTAIRMSPFGSAFVFAGVLLPIVVAALGVLNIPMISHPASVMLQELMAAVPNIIGAGITLLVAYFVSKFVVFMLIGPLEGVSIDALPAKLGAQSVFTASFTPTRLIGVALMFFSMLAAATAAVNLLGIVIVSEICGRVLEFGGGLLVGGVILIISRSTIAYGNLSAGGNVGLANIVHIAILGFALAMGLRSMGLADSIVNMAFGFTVGSVAVAVALTCGMGARDAARTIADSWAAKITQGTGLEHRRDNQERFTNEIRSYRHG